MVRCGLDVVCGGLGLIWQVNVIPSKHAYMGPIWATHMGSATGFGMGPIWVSPYAGCTDGSHITVP